MRCLAVLVLCPLLNHVGHRLGVGRVSVQGLRQMSSCILCAGDTAVPLREHKRNSPSWGEVWEGSWLYDSNKKWSLGSWEIRGELPPLCCWNPQGHSWWPQPKHFPALSFIFSFWEKEIMIPHPLLQGFWNNCQRIFENPCSLQHSLRLLTTEAFFSKK